MTFAVHRSAQPTRANAARRSAATTRKAVSTRSPPTGACSQSAACRSPKQAASLPHSHDEIDSDRPGRGGGPARAAARSTPAPRSSPVGRASAAWSPAAPCWPRTGTGTRTSRLDGHLDRRKAATSGSRRSPRPACWPRSASTPPARHLPEHPALHRGRRRDRHADPRPAPAGARDLRDRRGGGGVAHRRNGQRLVRGDRRTPGDVAHVELSPGGANVLRGKTGAHTNHFLEPPQRGTRHHGGRVPDDPPAPRDGHTEPLLEALRSHDGHPKGVCRHVDDRPVGRSDGDGRLGRHEPREAAPARRRRPAVHARAHRAHAAAVSSSVGSHRQHRGNRQRPDDHAQREPDRDVPTSTSSIFTPMNARMNARPWVR